LNNKNAVKKLQNCRANGPGRIPTELIKHGTEKLFEMLRDMFEKCINGGNTPDDWKIAYVTPIYKKGKRNNCNNYRGISVTVHSVKLMGML
jgi:hypothetical protein